MRDGVITMWNPIVVPGARSPAIPKPTPEQIATWLTDPAIIASAKAAALDPEWRAMIAALCVMTACTDEDAAWAAFLAAIP